jgi:hypothetical protein
MGAATNLRYGLLEVEDKRCVNSNPSRYRNPHFAEGNKTLHCPSFQFVETARLMAHTATNHVLKFFLLKDQDRLSWNQLGLSRCNNNPLEGYC